MRKLLALCVGGAFALALCLAAPFASAAEADSFDQLLRRADLAKGASYAEFETLIADMDARSQEMTATQREYLKYLHGWRFAFTGNYQQAVTTLKEIADSTGDPTIRFRASATIVNVSALAKQYEQAFNQLRSLLELLPQITDQNAREQGLSVTAYLYNLIGEYDLALSYAQILRKENRNGRGACTGGQLELQALFKNKGLYLPTSRFQQTISECEQVGEYFRASAIRPYLAKRLMDDGRYDEALQLLSSNYETVVKLGSPQLASEYASSIALSYRQTGNTVLAKQFAMRAVSTAVKNEHTEPLVGAYRLLYLLAKEQGDTKLALEYHEKYSAADKGYLDDVGARQLAYQRVKHEVDFSKLQIDSLNKANEVLQLQRQLSQKDVENIRLYVVLLFVILVFIALWAYRTKRSQMHFKNLSRLDGLTGLCNRPHFIDIAERALADGLKSGQPICVIICDLDYFKRINDTFGHAAGDSALKKTATVFQAHLRKLDIVGRLGGEEFAMMLINCDAAAAVQRCDQMRLAIATVSVGEGSGAFSLTASFGIVSTAHSGHELRRLLADADAALYQAKLSGRNRVIQFGSSNVTREGEPGNAARLTPTLG